MLLGWGSHGEGIPREEPAGSPGENLGSQLVWVPKISGSLRGEMNKEILNRNEFQEVLGIGSMAKGPLPMQNFRNIRNSPWIPHGIAASGRDSWKLHLYQGLQKAMEGREGNPWNAPSQTSSGIRGEKFPWEEPMDLGENLGSKLILVPKIFGSLEMENEQTDPKLE